MGTPEFPNLGQHCSVRECSLVDFLPFSCDACQQVFCLEHRTYGNHQCPKANSQDVTVLVCPMCAKAVRLIPSEDPNLTWERHVQSNCDPSNYTKATKKPRCPVLGCKELLTFSNKVRCKDCGREICLKHRFGSDHGCQEFRKADASKNTSMFGSQFFKSFREKASLGASGGAKNGTTGVSTVRSASQTAAITIGKGITKLGSTTNSILTTVKSSTQRWENPTGQTSSRLQVGGDNSGARELCPQCGGRFRTVVELIQHAENVHSTGQWRVGGSQEQLDVCPKCGRGFNDAISLVNHVERDHGGTSNDTGDKCTIS